jgi:signal transduction histidine kinase
LLEYQIEQNGINVVNRLPPQVPLVKGDGDGLQQVFINLLLNAIQAMPLGGTLTLESQTAVRRKGGLDLAPPQPFTSISIADTGVGIPEELRDQIFEPFCSTKADGEGTGLGLTVVQGIVKEHDGWIEVVHQSEERFGTIFRVHLPVEAHPGEQESQRET